MFYYKFLNNDKVASVEERETPSVDGIEITKQEYNELLTEFEKSQKNWTFINVEEEENDNDNSVSN